MARLAADKDGIAAAAGECVGERVFGMQCRPVLVQLGHLKAGAQLHIAGIGRQLAGQEFEQGGFARAVRPDNADAVAAMDAQSEIADHQLVAEAFGYAFGVDHLGAGAAAFQRLQLHRAHALQLLAPPLAQTVQPRQPALVALAPSAAAMGEPVQLHGDLAVALVAFRLFLFQDGVAPILETPKNPGPAVWSGRDPAIPPRGTDSPESAGHG